MATQSRQVTPGCLLVHRDWLLTPHRAIVHAATATTVIADLHLGYDRARCRGGEAIPALSIAAIVAALTPLVSAHAVRRLVIAGDVVENSSGKEQMEDLLVWLRGAGVELAAIVPGNHDRGDLFSGLPCYHEGFELDGWRIVHGDGRLPKGNVILGHFHPCLRWDGDVSAPCYLVGDQHLVLPAFSRDAKGAGVLGVPRWESYRCAAIVGQEVLDFGDLRRLAGMKTAANPGRQRPSRVHGQRRRGYQ